MRAALTVFCVAPFVILAALWLRRTPADRNPQPAPAPVVGLSTAEWDELTALQDKARAELTTIRSHPQVRRIQDLIVANEAARIDALWPEVQKEWSE